VKPFLSTQPEFTIGRLAAAANVNVETVRYYQRIGLIDEPKKPDHGFRKYPVETLEHIRFIKRAQQLGFSLKEIADLLEFSEGHCRDVRIRAEEKREKIKNQIRDLEVLQGTLTQLINACYSGNEKLKCPIVETLLSRER